MSFVNAVPEALDSAATDLARLGSTISAANTAAAVQTTGVGAAAEDEVSTAIAALFGTHGQEFQAVSAQAGLFHDQFVSALTASAESYGATEAANLTPVEHVYVADLFPDFVDRALPGDGGHLFPDTHGNSWLELGSEASSNLVNLKPVANIKLEFGSLNSAIDNLLASHTIQVHP